MRRPRLSSAGASAAAAAACALLDGGYLRIYSGAQPPTVDDSLGAQVLLAELDFGSPAFGGVVDGRTTAHAEDTDAKATGVASWFRAVEADGLTPVFDGTVGTDNADVVLTDVEIERHAQVSIELTYVQAPRRP